MITPTPDELAAAARAYAYCHGDQPDRAALNDALDAVLADAVRPAGDDTMRALFDDAVRAAWRGRCCKGSDRIRPLDAMVARRVLEAVASAMPGVFPKHWQELIRG